MAYSAWLYYHRPGRESGRNEQAGLPDLVALHPCGRVLFLELKSVNGKLSDAQKLWQFFGAETERHTRGFVKVRVLRPGDEDEAERLAACPCDRMDGGTDG